MQTIIGLDLPANYCDNHLTENEIAQYVDALVSDKQDQLPKEILVHVEECLECKVEISN